MLAYLKIPTLYFFPSWCLFFPPSFLFSSFSDYPFWQPLDSFAHPTRESLTQGVGQTLAGLPAVQVQVGSISKGSPPPSTQSFQMPINRCQQCWPGLRDPCLHNNPTILALQPVSINMVVFEPLGPVEFTSMLSRSPHWASA